MPDSEVLTNRQMAAAAPSSSAPQRLEASRKRLTLVATILGSSIAILDSSVVSVALPSIQRSLGGGLPVRQARAARQPDGTAGGPQPALSYLRRFRSHWMRASTRLSRTRSLRTSCERPPTTSADCSICDGAEETLGCDQDSDRLRMNSSGSVSSGQNLQSEIGPY